MHNRVRTLLAASTLVLIPSLARAEDIEGRIDSINAEAQSFVVQGISFYVTPSTDYDDDLKGFGSLSVGQKVEVDFQYRDGRHYAKEIEPED